MIKHYQNCNANYPEKPANEKPQHIFEDDDIFEDEVVHTCVDCGAFEIKPKERKNADGKNGQTETPA